MNEIKENNGAFVMTLLDTTGIQSYIFRSNILKHIMGASGLVHLATHDWADQVLRSKTIGSSNVRQDGSLDTNQHIEDGVLDAELVYRGGGNVLILFKNKDLAKSFTTCLTERLLREAPGLEVVVVHEEIPEDIFGAGAVNLKQHLQNLFQSANQKKKNRKFNVGMPGLGVTAACPYTQKPVTDRLQDEFVSAEIFCKEQAGYQYAKEYFDKEYQKARGKYDFVLQFNQFSAENKGSYMAVVHADGTGMGQRILDLLDSTKFSTARAKLDALRAFSDSIKITVREVMSALIEKLADKAQKRIIPLAAESLPFRPIVVDGDDITFVCDGKIGLTASAILLKEFSKHGLSDGRGVISCRVGTAVMKSHFPFSRAYQLAEELNQSARDFAKANIADNGLPSMAMDWYIATSGEISSLVDLKQKHSFHNNVDGDFSLFMRPVLLSSTSTWRTWENFENLVNTFTNDPTWSAIHSKLRGLRDVIKEGSNAVQKYCTEQCLPALPSVQQGGQQIDQIIADQHTVHYDALEAEDFII